MRENALFEIFSSLKKFCGKDLNIHQKIAFISQFATELCFPTYFTDLGAQVKIYKTLYINPVISVNVYDNPSFCSELIVSFKGEEHPWLTMKASTIKNGGFGVFAARSFAEGEFVTCYLGVLDLEPQDVTYTFKKINAAPELPQGEIKEDYWFGHRINHGSGDKVNVTVNESYTIKSCKEIRICEELFVDYNRQLYCTGCNKETDFFPKKTRKRKCCDRCGKYVIYGKKCCDCEKNFLCLECYDLEQIDAEK